MGAGPDVEEVFIACDTFTGPRDGYAFKKGPEGLGYYLDEGDGDDSTAPAANKGGSAGGAVAAVGHTAGSAEGDEEDFPERTQPLRDGMPLTEELIRRKAEHNEGMLLAHRTQHPAEHTEGMLLC